MKFYMIFVAALLDQVTYQMDIAIDKDLKKVVDRMKASHNASSNSSATTSGATSLSRRKWPGGVVPYEFDNSVGKLQ